MSKLVDELDKLIKGFNQPLARPACPNFASGPVKKVVSWGLTGGQALEAPLELLGRSHRSTPYLEFMEELLKKFKHYLGIPEDYKIVCLTGGATAAMEMALWNLVGPKDIDCLVWDVFGALWHHDLTKELPLASKVKIFKAEVGKYPDLSKVNFKDNDVVFTFSGTTAGVVFKDEHLIPDEREGLVITDATSYLLANEVDWTKLDAVAFSWQKIIAGEAAHGMLVLSPRALKRLASYTPSWPIPRMFRLKKIDGEVNEVFLDTGIWVNTPSALAVLDASCNLDWLTNKGGLQFARAKVAQNYQVVKDWVASTPWVDFLVSEESYRSSEVLCLKIISEEYLNLTLKERVSVHQKMLQFLTENAVAYDINMHAATNLLGFRLWAGYNVETQDIVNLTKWLDAAYLLLSESLAKNK